MSDRSEITMGDLNEGEIYFTGRINPAVDDELSDSDEPKKVRHVRYIYCSDGVVTECDEDEQEREQKEKEEKQREIETQRELDEQAKNLTWLPWLNYKAKKSASQSFEAADFIGEKLAWWLGITKPKFYYELEEHERLKKEQEEARENDDDRAEEILVGMDGKAIVPENISHMNTVNIDKGQLFQNS